MAVPAISGTATFNRTADKFILRALRQVGAIEAGETPSADMVSEALEAFNAMVKEWGAIGIHLWTEEEAILFLQPNQAQYALGPLTNGNPSPDICVGSNSWSQSTLTATAATGAGTVSLVSAAGISTTDGIGIGLDTGAIYWTTVNGAPAGNVVTLTAPLPSQATIGNPSFSYVAGSQIIRPLRIPAGRRIFLQSLIETPITRLSRSEYMDLPNKTGAPGIVTQFFYAPVLGQGLFYAWPAPVDATSAVRFTWYRPLYDFDNLSNLPDFPQEWINTLTWNLAQELGPEYDVPDAKWTKIVAMASNTLQRVQGWDREPESIYFGQSYDPSGR